MSEITQEDEMQLRITFGLITVLLEQIHDIVPINNNKLLEGYRKINMGIIEFSFEMKQLLNKKKSE